jgi:hypothetical protein
MVNGSLGVILSRKQFEWPYADEDSAARLRWCWCVKVLLVYCVRAPLSHCG